MTATTLELGIANSIMNAESMCLGAWLREEEAQLQARTAEVESAWLAADWDGTTPPLLDGARCVGSSLTEYAAEVSISLEFGIGANGIDAVAHYREIVTQAFCAGVEPEVMAGMVKDVIAAHGWGTHRPRR